MADSPVAQRPPRTLGSLSAEADAAKHVRHTAPRGRVCRTCPTVLSIYNLGTQCRPCTRAELGIEDDGDTARPGAW